MITLHAISNHLGGNPTVTLGALAHWCERVKSGFSCWDPSVFPSKSTVGYPTRFSIGRGYPSSSGFTIVFNQETPLSFNIGDFVVRDFFGLERVYNNQGFVGENQFGSYPKQKDYKGNDYSNGYLNRKIGVGNWVNDTLANKEKIQGEGQARPNQVAFRSENLRVSHRAIISGNLFIGKLK